MNNLEQLNILYVNIKNLNIFGLTLDVCFKNSHYSKNTLVIGIFKNGVLCKSDFCSIHYSPYYRCLRIIYASPVKENTFEYKHFFKVLRKYSEMI